MLLPLLLCVLILYSSPPVVGAPPAGVVLGGGLRAVCNGLLGLAGTWLAARLYKRGGPGAGAVLLLQLGGPATILSCWEDRNWVKVGNDARWRGPLGKGGCGGYRS